MKRIIWAIGVIVIGALLWWRGVQPASAVRVGVTAGPHAQIAEDVKARLKKHGINIEIIEFNDFHMPNAALDAGDLDLNVYQHSPFLQEDCRIRGLKLKVVGRSILMPMGLYSSKYKETKNIPANAKIAIPNDPTNRQRALELCKEIGFKEGVKYIEVDAPQLPRSLEDVDAALIPTDWIIVSKMDPYSALYQENPDRSPYTNVIVAKEGVKPSKNIEAFLDHYQNNETKQYIHEVFHGLLIPGW